MAGKSEETTEIREIEYEDLTAPEMGIKSRYQLCPHCWAKGKYEVTGKIKTGRNGKKQLVPTEEIPPTPFSISISSNDINPKG